MPLNYIQLVNFSSAMSWFHHHWCSFSFCSNVFDNKRRLGCEKNLLKLKQYRHWAHDETEFHCALDNGIFNLNHFHLFHFISIGKSKLFRRIYFVAILAFECDAIHLLCVHFPIPRINGFHYKLIKLYLPAPSAEFEKLLDWEMIWWQFEKVWKWSANASCIHDVQIFNCTPSKENWKWTETEMRLCNGNAQAALFVVSPM